MHTQRLGPSPGISEQQVWECTQKFTFLTSSQVNLGLLFWEPHLRATVPGALVGCRGRGPSLPAAEVTVSRAGDGVDGVLMSMPWGWTQAPTAPVCWRSSVWKEVEVEPRACTCISPQEVSTRTVYRPGVAPDEQE